MPAVGISREFSTTYPINSRLVKASSVGPGKGGALDLGKRNYPDWATADAKRLDSKSDPGLAQLLRARFVDTTGRTDLVNKLGRAVYLGLLLLVAAECYRDRYHEWNYDLFGYLASAVCSSESDPAIIHSIVFREAKAEVPDAEFALLAHPTDWSHLESTSYRIDLANNAFHFAEQIPFYSVKPAYVRLIVVLHKLGMTRIQAAKLLSVIGYLALGIVFFSWSRACLNTLPSVALASMFMLSQPILDSARLFTPDAVSVAVVTGALYALFARKRELIGMTLLCCSVFVRTDNLVFAVAVIGYLALASRSPVTMKPTHGAILIGLLCALVMLINHLAGNYGWQTLVTHSIVHRITAPAEVAPHVSILNYLHAFSASAHEALHWSSLLLFSFIAAACLLLMRPGDKMRDLLLLGLAVSVFHVLVYPNFEERYFLSAYVIVAMSLISASAAHSRGDGINKDHNLRGVA